MSRIKERTSHNGAALIAVGVIVLVAIVYGAWSIWKKED